MADRYWVGGSGTWNTTSTTNWSTTSGGTGGASVPTAADSVFFDQAGTYNVTMTGALNCLDLNVTNGTVSFVTGTTPTLSVAGNWNTIAATVWDSTGTITFTSTSLTSTINSNNILINASVVFNKAGATWTLQSNFTTRNSSPINSVTLTAGTLALSSFTLTTCSFISNNSNTRTIAFGTGKIVLNVSVSATIWNTTTVTGLTTTGSKLVESIGANVSLINKVIDTGAISEGNSVDFSFLETITGATYIFTAGNRVRNLVINGVQTISNIAITIFGGLTHTTTNGTTTFSSGTNTWTFGATSGSYNITPAVAFPFPITFNGTGGTWVLQSNLTTTGGSTGITFSNGTVDYNGQRITSGTGAVTVGGGTSITVRNASDPLSSGMTHNASGQAFVLGSNCSFQRYQLDSGTLSLNNFSLSLASSSAVNFYGGFNQTRTINFGTSGNITVIRDGATSGTVFSFDGVASLTISGTPLVIVQGNGSATKTISTWNTWSQSNALSFQLNATAGTIAFGFSQCRNLTINGTFTFTASSPVIYGSYTYVSGTIATNSDSTGWTFGATSGGPYTIDFGGVTHDTRMLFGPNAVNTAVYTFNSNITLGASRPINFQSGTWDFNNKSIVSGASFEVGIRTITFRNTGGTTISVPFNITHGSQTSSTEALILEANLTTNGTYNFTGNPCRLKLNSFTLTCDNFSSSATPTRTIDFDTGRIDLTGNNKTIWTTGTIGGFAVTGNVYIRSTYTGATGTRTFDTGGMSEALAAAGFNVNTSGTSGIVIGTSATDTVALTGNYNNFDLTGLTNTLSNTARSIYGNFIVPSSGGTLTGGTNATTFIGSASRTITTNGRTIDFPITVNKSSASLQLNDALTLAASRTFTLSGGTFDLNTFTLSTPIFSATGTTARTLAFGTSQIALTGNGATIFDITTATNFSTTGTVYINSTYTGATGTRSFVTGFSEAQAAGYDVKTTGTSGIVFGTTATDTVAFAGNYNNFDLTGLTNTLSNTARTLYGNFTVPAAGGTLTVGTNATTFSGTGTELITTNGRSIGFPITINSTGTTRLVDALTITNSVAATLQAGTLDLNGFTLTSAFFVSSFSTSRTIAFNGGQIAINGNAGNPQLDIGTATNFFWTGTPYFNLTYTGSVGTRVISLGSTTQGTFVSGNAFDISVSGTSGVRLGTGTDIIAVQGFMNDVNLTGMTFTFGNRTRTIFGNFTVPASGGTYENGSFTNTMVSNSSRTIDTNGRATVSNFIIGTAGTTGTYTLLSDFTCGAGTFGNFTLVAGTLDLNNRILTCANAFLLSSTSTKSINFGTSGQITLTQFANGSVWDSSTTNSQNFSWTGTARIFANYTGGTGTRRVDFGSAPIEGAFDIRFASTVQANAFTFATSTDTLDIRGNVKTLNFSGTTNTISGVDVAAGRRLYGDFVLPASGGTFNATGTPMQFIGSSGTNTITSNGRTFPDPIQINCAGKTIRQNDATILSTQPLTLTAGTLDLNNFTFQATRFNSTGTGVRSISFGTTGQITVTDSNTTVVDISDGTNFSYTGIGKIVSTFTGSTGTRTFNIGSTTPMNSAFAFDVNVYGVVDSGINLSGSATDTVALNGVYRNVDLRGNISNAPFNSILSNTARLIAGNLFVRSANGTYTAGTAVTTFIGNTSTFTIDTAQRALDFPFAFNGNGTFLIANTFTSGSSAVASTRALTLTSGNVSFNGVQINCGTFSSSGTGVRNLDFGANGRILLTSTASTTTTYWDTTVGTNFTWSGVFDVDINNTGAVTTRTINFGTLSEQYAPNVKIATAGPGFGLNAIPATDNLSLSGNMGNLDLTGFVGTLSSASRTVFGNLTFPTGGTISGSAQATTLAATSGTKTITYNNRTADFPLTIDGLGGTFVANGPINIGATRTFTLANGTFDSAFHAITANNILITTGNVAVSNLGSELTVTHVSGDLNLNSNIAIGRYAFSAGNLNLNSFFLTTNNFVSVTTTPRAINFGTGRLTVGNSSGGTIWNTGTITNLRTSGSGNVHISSGGSAATTINPGTLSEANSLNFFFPPAGSYSLTITSGSTVKTLDFRGPVSGGFVGTLVNGDRTVFGDFITSTGMSLQAGSGTTTFANTSSVQNIVNNGKTLDFPITINGPGGSVRLREDLTIGATRTTTLTAGTLDLNNFTLVTNLFSSTNSNIRSISFANTGKISIQGVGTTATVWNTGTVTNFSYTGNSNIEMGGAGPAVRTINTGPMNSNQSMNWRLGDFNTTIAFTSGNAVKNLTIQGSHTLSNIPIFIHGNYRYVSGATMTPGTSAWTFAGNNQTIDTGGLTHDFPFTFDNTGLGSVLQSAVTIGSTRQTTLANGVLDLNGFNYSTGSFFTNSGNKTLQFDGGTLTVVGSGTAFNNANNTGFVTVAGSNTGVISMTSASAKTFVGNNANYRARLNQGGAGQLTITGNNAFEDLSASITATSNATISFAANTITNFNVFTMSGNSVSNRFATLNSDNAASVEGLSSILEGGVRIYRSNTVYYRASLSCNATSNVSNGFVTGINYIQCRDIAFLPAPTNGSDFYRWYVGSNSLSLDNNVGAVFRNFDANNITKVYVIEANTSWTVPNDFNVSNNSIHLFGGGGAGAMGGARFGGGGGGGGGYTRANNVFLARNQTITIEVGRGGSNSSLNGGNTRVFSGYGNYNANGGLGASNRTGGAGGRGTTFIGGTGGNGDQNINYVQFGGGGGGGAAGPTGNGASGGSTSQGGSSNFGAGGGGGGASGGTAGAAGGNVDAGSGGQNASGFGRGVGSSGNATDSFAGGGGAGSGQGATIRASSGSAGIDFLGTFSGGGGGGGGGPDNSHALGALNAAAIAGIGGRFGGGGGGGASASTSLFAIGSAGGTGGVVITYRAITPTTNNIPLMMLL